MRDDISTSLRNSCRKITEIAYFATVDSLRRCYTTLYRNIRPFDVGLCIGYLDGH